MAEHIATVAYTTDELVTWLENKWQRHREVEDKFAAERLKELSSKLDSFGPLKPPSEQAREVFAKVLENDSGADMKAIPNQWLLNERGVSQVLSDNIATLESRLDSAQKLARAAWDAKSEGAMWQALSRIIDALEGTAVEKP